MKKLVFLILAVAILLSACSSTKFPMSEQHKKYGEKALEIVDAYLDFDLTVDEAEEKLNNLYKSKSALPADTEKERDGNMFVKNDVTNLYFSFNLLKINGKTPNDILEQRNSLAELLGEKQR